MQENAPGKRAEASRAKAEPAPTKPAKSARKIATAVQADSDEEDVPVARCVA